MNGKIIPFLKHLIELLWEVKFTTSTFVGNLLELY